MKTFNLESPNFMVNKTYKVINNEDESVSISVSSPFIGNWDFNLTEMSYEQVCYALNLYCAGALIQTCFSNLPPSLREKFITPPSLWEGMNV